MVLLPEEAEMTLAELRQMAARQQHQIEAQQQLLIAKEQRLKFLKQQEARHHHLTELKIDPSSVQNLKEKVDAQGLKLRQLRALHGQVEQQKTNNCNLGAELESVRALFSEKEKELSIAVTKVEELTRQLNDIRKNSSRKSNMVPLAVSELENLRRELMYRTKLTEQQNQHISQQRSVISERQKDIHQLDDKIAELTQRLRRKRLMNQQLANQIHNAALARHTVNTHVNVHSAINIAAVEPIQRELQDPDQTRDDLSAKLSGIHQSDLYEFSLKKNDPKYQTLPYNTKFHVKGKSNQDDFSPPDDDSSDSLTDFQSGNIVEVVKPNPNMGNFVPRPFSSSFVSNNHISSLKTNIQQSEQKKDPIVIAKPNVPVHIVPEALNNIGNNNCTKKDEFDSVNASTTLVKQNPVQHNRPVFDKVESAADYKKTKEKFSGAVVKPVVPPKPSFPVKPVPPPRQTPVTPTKERSTEDTNEMVSKALSVLQNKSTEKEKNAFSNYKDRLLYYHCVLRYNVHNNTSNVENSSVSEPKIATYFPKPSSVPGPNKNSNIQDNVKRKQTAGQLPIKPKPLTIRKTPGLEPPKLKQQQNSSTLALRKVQETNTLASNFKPVVSPLLVEPPLPQTDSDVAPVQESVKIVANNVEESEIGKDLTKQNNVVEDKCPPFITIEEVKPERESPEHTESDNKRNESNFKSPDPDDSDGSSSSPCDSLECVPIHESSKVVKTELVNGEKEASFNQNSTYHRVKGNLKTETSVRSPRRVSFDPLALLLDAALEGELELVKKTIREVPNPSAANDEGITALHNSICAGHFDVVTFLVEFGCDLNAPDSDGWTPLHCAASCNNLPMVKFLVERGACIFATTLSDHETAAEKCDEEEEGFEGCSEYLYGLQENLGIIYDGIVYAVYDYEGQNADELSFKDGDQIKVLRNGDEQEQEWWWARLNDEEGYIPRNLLGLYPRISIKKDEK